MSSSGLSIRNPPRSKPVCPNVVLESSVRLPLAPPTWTDLEVIDEEEEEDVCVRVGKRELIPPPVWSVIA